MPQRAILWDTFMRQAPIGVLLVDARERVLDANPVAELLLDGAAGSRLSGLSSSELFGPAASQLVADGSRVVIDRIRADGSTQSLAVIRSVVDTPPIAGMYLFRDAPEAEIERARAAATAELLLQKTLLEAQLEAATEGILVQDEDGRLTSFNRRLVSMWGLDERLLATGDRDVALAAVLPQVRDPDAFVARIEELGADPFATARDEVIMRDGRVFSRYTAPVVEPDGRPRGRVWFFNDVTEQRRNEDALRFATEVADVLASTLDPRVTLTRIARLAVPRLADWCVIYRSDADGVLERVAIEFSDPADTLFARTLEGFTLDESAQGGVAEVIRSGRSQLRSPVTPEELAVDVVERERFADTVRQLGVSAWMCVPLEARGRVLGAMSFITSHSGRGYDAHDLALAEDLGHRAGLAMDNAALFEHQRNIARTLQQSLLPRRLPTVEGVEVAVRYLAAGEGFDVGGDFYDLFPAGEDTWGIVIGDVVGKGPEAAALTALARYTTRTAAMLDPSPAAVLTLLNEAIYRQHDGTRFCTAAYALIRRDRDGFSVSLARAGHPPPLVLRASGSVDDLAPPGLLLGLFPDPILDEVEVRLGPGDSFVLYTDGVVEARNASRTFGEHELTELLERCPGLDADRCADEIEHHVLELQDGRAHDDVALLVLRVDGGPTTAGTATNARWFPGNAEALREARAFVRAALAGVGDDDLLETAVLLTGELAANAVRHARSEFRVSVGQRDGVLRIEVRDLSTLQPELLAHDPNATNGRGLPIVAAESLRWGIARRADGKAVWFELDLDPGRGDPSNPATDRVDAAG